jgi:hypothetical protein
MYESRTSLVYTFRLEEIFEFLSKSVHPRNEHGSYRFHEDKYIPRYVHGTSVGCRVPVGYIKCASLRASITTVNTIRIHQKSLFYLQDNIVFNKSHNLIEV